MRLGDKMSVKILDGKIFKAMLIGGAENIRENLEKINELNVFPVPDGDTGTNMTKTLEGGILEISSSDSNSVSEIITAFARGVLLGARGNSGVILSQIFAGIKDGLADKDSVSPKELARAYGQGIERSYSAVVNPTEGTILTVFRESTEYAASRIDDQSDIDDFLRLHIEEAERSLARTKELLPVLAEADVVDSGAAGYLAIANGMYYALTGRIKPVSYSFDRKEQEAKINIDSFTRDSKLEFGYCTEFLLRLTTDRCDPDTLDPQVLISILESLGGESIVCYKTEDILKVHVHTFDPGRVLTEARAFGEFLTVKIENMSVSHTEEKTEKKKKKKYSVIAVATGDGICSLFTHLGADGIISGGQTANPSTEEFIEEFRKQDAENIIVLPNNKNVFLAAKQAADLYDGAKIHIVPTESIMQGYGALSVITPGITDVDMLVKNATSAARGVVGGEITHAVRSVVIDGKSIKEGDFIAISGHDILAVADSAEDALTEMIREAPDAEDMEILTVFVGKEVSEDRRIQLTERLEEEFPELDITVYEGGQEVYDYLVALE